MQPKTKQLQWTKATFAACFLASALTGCGCAVPFTYQTDEANWKSNREQGIQAEQAKNWPAAERFHLQAVECARRLSSAGPLHLAQSLQDLADSYLGEGKQSEAIASYEKALQAYLASESANGKGTNQMYYRLAELKRAECFLALGKLYGKRGDDKLAEMQYKDALNIKGFGVGATPILVQIKDNYGQLLSKQGRKDEKSKLEADINIRNTDQL